MVDSAKDRIDLETDAVVWPPAEYRDWVQSQIASRIFLRLGGVTLASALILGSAVITYFQLARQGIIDDVVDRTKDAAMIDLRSELDLRVDAAVANTLLDRSTLVEDTLKQAQAQLESQIPELVAAPGFITPASDAVFQAIRDSGGSQRLILDEARERLFDAEGDGTTRALGLRIYVLFQPGVQSRQDVSPLRQTLVELVEAEPESLPPRLVDAILEHYPMSVAAVTPDFASI